MKRSVNLKGVSMAKAIYLDKVIAKVGALLQIALSDIDKAQQAVFHLEGTVRQLYNVIQTETVSTSNYDLNASLKVIDELRNQIAKALEPFPSLSYDVQGAARAVNDSMNKLSGGSTNAD